MGAQVIRIVQQIILEFKGIVTAFGCFIDFFCDCDFLRLLVQIPTGAGDIFPLVGGAFLVALEKTLVGLSFMITVRIIMVDVFSSRRKNTPASVINQCMSLYKLCHLFSSSVETNQQANIYNHANCTTTNVYKKQNQLNERGWEIHLTTYKFPTR